MNRLGIHIPIIQWQVNDEDMIRKAGRMKLKRARRIVTSKMALLLTIVLAGSMGLAGCQDEKALENQQAYRKVGINKMNEGDYAEAVKSFQKALDQSKGEVGDLELDICYYKATAQYKSGDTKGALTTCDALIDFDKGDAKAYFIRGSIYLKEEDGENAQKDYGKALDLCGEDYALYLAVYENLSGAGFSDQAEQLMTKVLKLKGDQAEDYRERGHIYLIRGDYENARKELDQAINKGDTKALLYLAQVYDAQGKAKKAQPLYENYLKKNGSDAATLTAMGDSQLEAENYQKALEFFQQALNSEIPENERHLRRHVILGYVNLSDFATAKQKMAEYLEDYPDDEKAQRENMFLQTR